MDIYEPAEDSYLLAEAVKQYAKGKVLDVGTGSGIQAKTALKNKKVASVTATDINKNCSKNLGKSIKFICSDLFEKVPKQKFDTIIFNPPYLPQDKSIRDERIYGGRKGYEIIERFLDSCSSYLSDKGIILLVFSSLSRKNMIDCIIEDNCLEKEELSRKELPFFEVLYIYKIRKSQLLLKLGKNRIRRAKKFAEGKRGTIYVGKFANRKVAVKVKRKDSAAKGNIANEARWLKILNKKKIGPKLISSGKDYLIYEFVEGKFIIDFIKNCSSRKTIVAVIENILQQCRMMDKLKVNKEEMLRPYRHVIIGKGNTPVLIDFERCHKSLKPKNVTQFCQFLISGNVRELVKAKGIVINRKKILDAAKKYKANPDCDSFERLTALV